VGESLVGRVANVLRGYTNPYTIKNLRWSIRTFFTALYGDVVDLDACGDRYIAEGRDPVQDLYAFLQYLDGRPPKTVRLMLSNVKTFLLENDVELPQKFWRRLSRRVKGSRAATQDRVPTTQELKTILAHMPIQGQSLYLFLASTGMRIGETLQLRLSDIDLDHATVHVRKEYTKSGNPRVCFFSSETRELLGEWLKNRDRYLDQSIRRSGRHGKRRDDRLFPFTKNTAYELWNRALAKSHNAQRDPSTGRRVLHVHTLRKFFRTKMAGAIQVDVVEALMGHEGYLTDVYRRYAAQDLAKFYRQGETALHVFTSRDDVGTLRAEIDEKNQRLQTYINSLVGENLQLKHRVHTLESTVRTSQDTMGILESEKQILTEQVDTLAREIRLINQILRDNEPMWFTNLRAPRRGAHVEPTKQVPPPVSHETRGVQEASPEEQTNKDA
jgi:integrase